MVQCVRAHQQPATALWCHSWQSTWRRRPWTGRCLLWAGVRVSESVGQHCGHNDAAASPVTFNVSKRGQHAALVANACAPASPMALTVVDAKGGCMSHTLSHPHALQANTTLT